MKYEKQYNEFLKEEIDKYCNNDKSYEIYWDYRDSLSPQDLLDAYQNEQSDLSVGDTLVDSLLNSNNDYEDHFYNQIEDDLIQQSFYDEKFKDWYSNRNLQEDLYDCGYNGLDENLKDLLRNSSFNLNICFATENEQNYDMTSLINIFGSYIAPDLDKQTINDFSHFDNALTYVVHQQGHTMQEYYDCLVENPKGFSYEHNCNFVESLVDENLNNSSDIRSEFAVMVKMNGNDAVEFLDNLKYSDEPYLNFSKDVICGVLNEWSGACGLLGINLNKDLIIPKSMVRDIQIEGANNKNYSINEICALDDSVWKEDCVSFTTEEPILLKEDYIETVALAKNKFIDDGIEI